VWSSTVQNRLGNTRGRYSLFLLKTNETDTQAHRRVRYKACTPSPEEGKGKAYQKRANFII
jgi:hypothetical protein